MCDVTALFSRFKTEIGLNADPYLWKVTGFIILVAVVGNFRSAPARFVGQKLIV
jgi:hypothetical protein